MQQQQQQQQQHTQQVTGVTMAHALRSFPAALLASQQPVGRSSSATVTNRAGRCDSHSQRIAKHNSSGAIAATSV
jgi:hypothetical protein